MSNQQTSRGDAAAGPQTGASTTAGGYAPQILQRLVDKAAYFNAFSIPDGRDSNIGIQGRNGDVSGSA